MTGSDGGDVCVHECTRIRFPSQWKEGKCGRWCVTGCHLCEEGNVLAREQVSRRAALGLKALLVQGAWGDAGQGGGVLGRTHPRFLLDFV